MRTAVPSDCRVVRSRRSFISTTYHGNAKLASIPRAVQNSFQRRPRLPSRRTPGLAWIYPRGLRKCRLNMRGIAPSCIRLMGVRPSPAAIVVRCKHWRPAPIQAIAGYESEWVRRLRNSRSFSPSSASCSSLALPRYTAATNRAAVQSAVGDAAGVFGSARRKAVTRRAFVAVAIDTSAGSLTIRAAGVATRIPVVGWPVWSEGCSDAGFDGVRPAGGRIRRGRLECDLQSRAGKGHAFRCETWAGSILEGVSDRGSDRRHGV